MTVALVANTAWNVVNFRMHLLLALRRDGHQLMVICPWDEHVPKIKQAGIVWYGLPALKRQAKNPLRDLQLIRELARLYKRKQVELVLHYTIKPVIYGSIAAYLTGTKVVNTITGLGYTFIRGGLIQMVVKNLYRVSLSKAWHTLFQNKDDLRFFVDHNLVRAEKASLVPGSGIDVEHFTYAPMVSQKNGRVLFLSRLLKDKGVYEFISVARKLKEEKPQHTFTVAGGLDHDNPASITSEELHGWIAEGVIEYLGELSDVRYPLADSILVVLPSYREGLPRVLLEAGAIGRPVVASDVPGCRSVVEHGVTGWLVPPGDAAALAEAVRHALDLPPETLALMGQRGRQRVEQQFSVERVTSIYRGLLARLEE
jgi:glycosyltransferase involved in cell wall biosynthesis